MAYKYFGYFLAVLMVVLGSLTAWILIAFFKEKSLIQKFASLNENRKKESEKGNGE